MRVGQPGHLVLLVLLLLLASPATASTQHGRLQNGQQAPLQHIHVAAPAPTSHAAQVPTAAQGTEPGGSAGEPRPPSYAPAARRLSLVPPASLTASGGPSKSSTQQNARRQSSCPSEYMEVTAPGCTCTVYHGDAGVGNSSDTDRLIRVNVCPAGQRCSPSAVQAIQAAGWSRAGGNATAALLKDLNPALTAQGICVPCQLGKHRPHHWGVCLHFWAFLQHTHGMCLCSAAAQQAWPTRQADMQRCECDPRHCTAALSVTAACVC